jgi:hypothetical protein
MRTVTRVALVLVGLAGAARADHGALVFEPMPVAHSPASTGRAGRTTKSEPPRTLTPKARAEAGEPATNASLTSEEESAAVRRVEIARLLDDSLDMLIRVHSGAVFPQDSAEYRRASDLISQLRGHLYDATRRKPAAARRHYTRACELMSQARTLLSR